MFCGSVLMYHYPYTPSSLSGSPIQLPRWLEFTPRKRFRLPPALNNPLNHSQFLGFGSAALAGLLATQR